MSDHDRPDTPRSDPGGGAGDDRTPQTRLQPGPEPPFHLRVTLDELDWDTGFPVRHWDRYSFVELIGKGGMGHVYKALDPRLGRPVALKFLHRDEPQVVQRFTREAQVQARVHHENVCQVYEVGEAGGHPYIAMQYVAGPSLKEIRDVLRTRDVVEIMVDVADALHAAHRIGLIHRDVKPANILVERTADGAWRPFVVDFGIAREMASHDLTATGMVVGTPAFSAPEQVRGDGSRLDERGDVYSLGATMYWLLTGQAPFTGSVPDMLVDQASSEPVPPHRLVDGIPVDVETIVLKCLEREPERRYSTAREVSEDLRRFLNREPVTARRTGPAYRMVKRIRRHPAVSATVAVFLVALLLLAGVHLRSQWVARQRTALVQRLVEEVKEIEGLMRIASMMPLHDRRTEEVAIRTRLDSINAEMLRLGDLAAGPGHYALGRGHLVLGDDDTAIEHLRKAIAAGYDSPSVSYALGLALSHVYQRELEEARRLDDPELRAAARRELESGLRAEALSHLNRARDLDIDSSSYVEGLIAFVEGRLDDALDKARAATRTVPWLYEGYTLEGDVLVARATDKRFRGDYDGALADLELAGSAYRRATDLARSDAQVYEGDCERWLQVLETSLRRGSPTERAYLEGQTACGLALEVDPRRASVHDRLARLHWRWADHQHDTGGDPSPTLERAVSSARRAIELAPDSARAYHTLGGALTVTGLVAGEQGRDPLPALTEATASLERAVEVAPDMVVAHDDLGYVWERRARFEMAAGEDPRPSLERAVDSYRRAIELRPTYANAFNNMGIALWRRAVYELRAGSDPEPSLDAAFDAYQRALELNPNYAYAYANRGLAARTAAVVAFNHGEDPSPWLDRARESLRTALEINDQIHWCYPEQAAVELLAARWEASQGGDPGAFLAAAEHSAAAAIAIRPTSAVAHQTLGEVSRWRAALLTLGSSELEREVSQGLLATARALELNPALASAMVTRAALLLERASSPGVRADRAVDEARGWLLRAEQTNPLLGAEIAEIEARLSTPLHSSDPGRGSRGG